jgi:hypothetical protein
LRLEVGGAIGRNETALALMSQGGFVSGRYRPVLRLLCSVVTTTWVTAALNMPSTCPRDRT